MQSSVPHLEAQIPHGCVSDTDQEVPYKNDVERELQHREHRAVRRELAVAEVASELHVARHLCAIGYHCEWQQEEVHSGDDRDEPSPAREGPAARADEAQEERNGNNHEAIFCLLEADTLAQPPPHGTPVRRARPSLGRGTSEGGLSGRWD